VTLGAIRLSNSSHFPLMYSTERNPVVLPPCRAKLSTKPAPTGSAAYVNTMGTMRVVCNNAPLSSRRQWSESLNLFCNAGGRLWPTAEMPTGSRGGRFLRYTRRRGDAADRRSLRQPDAGQQLATLVSGIEASSSMAATKLGGGN
jgi:hypothetical protein